MMKKGFNAFRRGRTCHLKMALLSKDDQVIVPTAGLALYRVVKGFASVGTQSILALDSIPRAGMYVPRLKTPDINHSSLQYESILSLSSFSLSHL